MPIDIFTINFEFPNARVSVINFSFSNFSTTTFNNRSEFSFLFDLFSLSFDSLAVIEVKSGCVNKRSISPLDSAPLRKLPHIAKLYLLSIPFISLNK